MPQRALPTISNPSEQQDFQKNQQIALLPSVNLPPTPQAPWNFKGTPARGAINFTWASVKGADGYELFHSDTGDFSPGNYHTHSLAGQTQVELLHPMGGAPATGYFKLRATAGTASNPNAVKGVFTGAIKVTSLDSTDTTTTPVAVNDNITSPKTQATARHWKSGVLSPFSAPNPVLANITSQKS